MVFSSNEDLDSADQQTSLIPTVEEVVREEEVQGEDAGSEQQFGVFKDFDFLDVELEDAEVTHVHAQQGSFVCVKLTVVISNVECRDPDASRGSYSFHHYICSILYLVMCSSLTNINVLFVHLPSYVS